MTTADRVQAVVEYGFTEREAKFLVLVMRHAGLCVKRQYAAFAGIANGGDRCNALFTKLTRRGFAVAVPCSHNRARLYHLHHKPLYHAIGESQSRYRRAVPVRGVTDRLIRLDAAVISPDLNWLTTQSEKAAYVAMTGLGSPESSAPLPAQDGVDAFTGAFPVGVDETGRVVVLYIATKPWTDEFRSFLAGHIPWPAVTRVWTLRIVFPSALQRVVPRSVNRSLNRRLNRPHAPQERRTASITGMSCALTTRSACSDCAHPTVDRRGGALCRP